MSSRAFIASCSIGPHFFQLRELHVALHDFDLARLPKYFPPRALAVSDEPQIDRRSPDVEAAQCHIGQPFRKHRQHGESIIRGVCFEAEDRLEEVSGAPRGPRLRNVGLRVPNRKPARRSFDPA